MIRPYIVCNGNCQDVMDFYKEVFSTDIKMQNTYGDYVPEGCTVPAEKLKNWIMHGEMEICGVDVWLADEAAGEIKTGNHIILSATVPSAAEAGQIFERLSAGAEITLPPTETFYSAFHAGLVDQFGVGWNIIAEEEPST